MTREQVKQIIIEEINEMKSHKHTQEFVEYNANGMVKAFKRVGILEQDDIMITELLDEGIFEV